MKRNFYRLVGCTGGFIRSTASLWRGLATFVFLATSAPAEEQPRFELLHPWGSESEKRALAIYSNAAIAGGVRWSEHVVWFNFIGVRAVFANRLSLSRPPEGLFWIGGESAAQLIDAGLFRKIPVKIGNVDFSELLVPEVYEVLRHGDGITMLPIGNHIQNRIFYNRRILEEVGAEFPQSWAEFLTLAPKIVAAGYDAIVLTDQRWQNRNMLLSILAEQLDADEMLRFLSGTDPIEAHRDDLIAAMKILIELRKHSNNDIDDLAWDAAMSKVYHKTGFAYMLGDFAGALIPEDDGTVICAAPPGNKYVMWGIGGIALTEIDDPASVAGQNIFIENLGRPENHSRHYAIKGGIPIFVDDDDDGRDSCSMASKRDWEAAPRKIFVKEWTETLDTFAATTTAVWQNRDMTAEQAVAQIIEAVQASREVKTPAYP